MITAQAVRFASIIEMSNDTSLTAYIVHLSVTRRNMRNTTSNPNGSVSMATERRLFFYDKCVFLTPTALYSTLKWDFTRRLLNVSEIRNVADPLCIMLMLRVHGVSSASGIVHLGR